MLDFNHKSGINPGSPQPQADISDLINTAIDKALIAKRANEPVRNYLGASQIGEECERNLQYSYTHTPIDEGREFTGQQLRIFATGHAAEEAIAETMDDAGAAASSFFNALTADWMSEAGFSLTRFDEDGKQYGFETLGGKFAGHIDGVIVGGPVIPGLRYPCGWESKALKAKSWNKIKKHKLRVASPVYYGQLQTYMPYMELEQFLFTALNKNEQLLHHEVINFDATSAQALSDKAVRVISNSESGNLLPRIASNPDFYRCKYCDWAKRCWKQDN